MFADWPLQTRPEEADQIDSDGAKAPIAVRSPVSFGAHELLPGVDHLLYVPACVGERLDTAAYGLLRQSGIGQRGHEGTATGQEASGHEGEEDLQEAQVGSHPDAFENGEQARTQIV